MTSYVIASGMKLGTGYFSGYSGFLSKYHTVHTITLYTLLVTITIGQPIDCRRLVDIL